METTINLLNMQDTLKKGLSASGAKAFNLARVKERGFNIPAGIVIPCTVVTSTENEALAKEVHEYLKTVAPGPWAVRSSGIAEDGDEQSFAGQFASILNVSNEAGLKDAIDKCICSASSAQVAAYGNEAFQPIALLIQQMVNADCAGVAFSANPVTGERNEVLINAVAGLGDKLVSGEVTPDEYTVKNGTISKTNTPGNVLTEKQAVQIAEAAKQLEKAFGQPQDIEWAIEKDELFILQSRPITALPPQPVPIPLDIPEGTWKRDDHHTTISPMGFSTIMIPYAEGMKKYFKAYGFPIQAFTPKMIGGHLYMQMLMEGGDQKGTPPDWVMWLVSRLLPSMRKMNKIMKKVLDEKLHHKEMQRWNDVVKPYFENKTKEFTRTDLKELNNEALLERFHALRNYMLEGVDAHADRTGGFIALGEFYLFCKENFGWDTSKFFRITAGWSSATSFVHDELSRLCQKHFLQETLSNDTDINTGIVHFFNEQPGFKKEVDRWIKANGLRMQDYDIINPTLGEHPEIIYRNVFSILQDMKAGKSSATHQNPEREQAFADARKQLSGTPQAAVFEELATWCREACRQRDENGLLTVTQPTALLRLQLLEMARRMGLKNPEHIFFLTEMEIEDAFTGKLSNRDALINNRLGEKQWAIFNRGPKRYGPKESPMPSPEPFPEAVRKMFRIFGWIDEVEMGEYENEKHENENVISGRAASPGIYKGKARIVKSPADFDKIKKGEVMICRITSGEWSMVFSSVGALVTDEGGMLSHPAIIAREFGIPAIVGTEVAMTKIKDGMTVTVDGNKGVVEINLQ